MIELLEKGKSNEAHPSFWAPFVLVGEGAPAKRRSATVDGNRGRTGLSVIEDPEVEGNSSLTEPIAPGRLDTDAKKSEHKKAASQVIPLPKRRPRLARKSRKRVPRKEKMINGPSGFWEASANR